MNQVPPPSQEDVGPVRIAADGVDHHQIEEVEQRATPPSSNEEQTNFPNVISQLASLVDKEKDPVMREQAELLAALLAPGPPILSEGEEEEEEDIPLDRILQILDNHHIIDDIVSEEGEFNDFINPFAFRACKKGNNPDVLSRAQMLKAQDKEKFLEAEEPELRGLEDFGVFEYMKQSDIPKTHQKKLLD